MLSGFKKFIMQGNVVDLAVGIVIGVAFGAVVSVFVTSMIDPLVALVLGNNANGLSGLDFTIGKQNFLYGSVISALITFIATAAAIYFAVVMPMNAMAERRKRGQAEEEVELTNEEKMVLLLEQIASK